MNVLPPRTYAPDKPIRKRLLPHGIQHPAKMHLELCRDLFLRYTREGHTVVDPFFGVGGSLVGITLGRNVIGQELEAPFVGYAAQNYEHLRAYQLGGVLGSATILQGDSRRLQLPDAASDVVAGSPPYADSISRQEPGARARKAERIARGEFATQRPDIYSSPTNLGAAGMFDSRYGDTPGQIGTLKPGDVDAAVGSPPFGEMNAAHAGGRVVQRPGPGGDGWDGGREDFVYSEETPGQIGNLPYGHARVDDACVASPPYLTENQGGAKITRDQRIGASQAALTDQHPYGSTPGQIYALPAGEVAAAIGSPPYGDLASRDRSDDPSSVASPFAESHGKTAPNRHVDGYGEHAPGQIGDLRHRCVVDAAVGSPPYAESLTYQRPGAGGEGVALLREGFTPSAIATMRRAGDPRVLAARQEAGYSRDSANIGNLANPPDANGRVDDAAVGSPPYASTLPKSGGEKGIHSDDGLTRAKKDYFEYSDGDDQISNREGETYAEAVLQVYRECWRVVRWGGLLVLVTGNYVRDGKIVDLAADTIKLCVAAGWTPVERWEHRKGQVSFFRRLHHRQGRPVVTHEDVLVFCKGPRPAWDFAPLAETRRAAADLDAELDRYRVAEVEHLAALPLDGVA